MRRLLIPITLLLAFGVIAAPASAATGAAKPRYYLSLGDSLSQGGQPDASGITRPTRDGYVDDLFAIEARRIPHLKLVKLGCLGESTSSFLTGKGNKYAAFFHCHPSGGSQMVAAERFLKAHKGQVSFVTISIGANDVDGCAKNGSIDGACLNNGFKTINQNVPKIAARLRARGKHVPMAGTTLYDPFLESYFNPQSRNVAIASVGLAQQLNKNLRDAFAPAKFRVAAVDNAFETYDMATMTTYEGQDVPIDVKRICQYTWMCTGPTGPNIHANHVGYQIMARAHATALGQHLH